MAEANSVQDNVDNDDISDNYGVFYLMNLSSSASSDYGVFDLTNLSSAR